MVADACSFEVLPTDLLGFGKLPPRVEGPVFLSGQWSLQPVSDLVQIAESRKA
jgi:hypothetical protein